jgi:hypothetical protein
MIILVRLRKLVWVITLVVIHSWDHRRIGIFCFIIARRLLFRQCCDMRLNGLVSWAFFMLRTSSLGIVRP